MPDPTVWADVRRDYENPGLTNDEICAKHNISRLDLTKRRLADDWRPRLSATEAATARYATRLAAEIHAAAEPPAASGPLPAASKAQGKNRRSIAQRRTLVQRLYNAIDTKLRLLERRFEREMAGFERTSSKTVSSADNERDIRSIGLLIKNLEHMTEYEHGTASGTALKGAAAKSVALASTQLADEADRLRRELGERLQRFIDTPKAGA